MLAAKTTLHPLPDLRALCVLCVKSHLQPRSDQSRHLAAKPSRIRTSAKHTRNPFRIRTSKTKDLKPFRMSTYRKRGRGGHPLRATLAWPDYSLSIARRAERGPIQQRLQGLQDLRKLRRQRGHRQDAHRGSTARINPSVDQFPAVLRRMANIHGHA